MPPTTEDRNFGAAVGNQAEWRALPANIKVREDGTVKITGLRAGEGADAHSRAQRCGGVECVDAAG